MILFIVQIGVFELILVLLFSWAAFVDQKKKKKNPHLVLSLFINAITHHIVCQPYVINSILCVFSLSGCPRAKKSGIKTPTKDNQEDSELLKFVLLRTPLMSALSQTDGKPKTFTEREKEEERESEREREKEREEGPCKSCMQRSWPAPELPQSFPHWQEKKALTPDTDFENSSW